MRKPSSQNSGAGTGGKKEKDACPELTREWSGGHENCDTNRPGNGISKSRTHMCKKLEAALARARVESAAKRRKTNSGESDSSARGQAELDKTMKDACRPALGGKPDVGRRATQSAQLGVTASRSGKQKFRFLSKTVSSTRGAPLGSNSISKSDKLWKSNKGGPTPFHGQQHNHRPRKIRIFTIGYFLREKTQMTWIWIQCTIVDHRPLIVISHKNKVKVKLSVAKGN